MRGFIISKANNPDTIEYLVSIKLPLSDWRVFLDQIKKMDGNGSYPAWHIINGIEDCIRNANDVFSKEIKSE